MSVTASNIQGTDWSGDVDENYRATINVTFRVTCNSRSDGPATVLAGARSASPHPVPQHYQAYGIGNDIDVTLFAKTFSVKPAGSLGSHSMLWDVVVTYGPMDKKEPGDDNPVPTDRPVKWGASYEPVDKFVTQDRDSLKIVNWAGLEYNPPPIRQKYELILTARQNVASLPAIFATCNTMFGTTGFGAKNDAEWNGIAAGKALFIAPSIGDLESVNGIAFYPVTWRFRVAPVAFVLELVERGNMVRPAAGEDPEPYVKNGIVQPGPHLLNSDGTRRDPAQGARTREWEIHESVNFRSTLGF